MAADGEKQMAIDSADRRKDTTRPGRARAPAAASDADVVRSGPARLSGQAGPTEQHNTFFGRHAVGDRSRGRQGASELMRKHGERAGRVPAAQRNERRREDVAPEPRRTVERPSRNGQRRRGKGRGPAPASAGGRVVTLALCGRAYVERGASPWRCRKRSDRTYAVNMTGATLAFAAAGRKRAERPSRSHI